jgi:hypothetical protein
MKLYKDADGEQFQVLEVEPTDGGVWVHYQRMSDRAEFSCLLDAFNDRFTEVEVSR